MKSNITQVGRAFWRIRPAVRAERTIIACYGASSLTLKP